MRRFLDLTGHVMLLLAALLIGYWLFGMVDGWAAHAHVMSRIETLMGSNESRAPMDSTAR